MMEALYSILLPPDLKRAKHVRIQSGNKRSFQQSHYNFFQHIDNNNQPLLPIKIPTCLQNITAPWHGSVCDQQHDVFTLH